MNVSHTLCEEDLISYSINARYKLVEGTKLVLDYRRKTLLSCSAPENFLLSTDNAIGVHNVI